MLMKLTQIFAVLLCACGAAFGQAPNIDTQPTGGSVCQGGSFTFTAAVSGATPLSLQWYKGTGIVTNATNTTLTLTNLATSATAGYTIVASNSSGSATSQVAQLTVLTNTTATALTAAPFACPGSTVVFTTTPGGSGPFSFVWRKAGGSPLAETSGTLTLPNVSGADAATYSVEVSGACTTVTNSAVLGIAVAPSITGQPQSQATPMGNGAVFTVTTAAGAANTYQWYTNGVAVVNGANAAGATSASLAISNLNLAMNGTLVTVAVSNCIDGLVSSPATLGVTIQSGISFDFNTPGQYTNAPYYLTYNNWINGGYLPANSEPTVYESKIGGTGPFPGNGSLDLAPNEATENTSVMLPVNYDFSQTGKVVVASVMFKVKSPTAGVSTSQRSTQIGFLTATNFGINDNTPQSFMTVIVQMENPATAAPNYSMRTQRRTSGGGLQESIVTATNTLTLSNWYKLTAVFINTKTGSGLTSSNFTVMGSLQDMGPFGTTPGITNMSFTTTTNSADITSSRNVYLAMRGFENTGVENRDNIYAFTTFGPIFFVQQPQSQTVLQGNRVSFNGYVDGEGQYTYQWQRDDGAGGFTNIPLAGSWNYILPPARTSDNGAQFRVVVTGPANTITSDPATLTVTPQTLAVVGAGSMDGTTVGVEFNQPVDAATAENPANYTINGVAPIRAQVYRTSLTALGPEGIFVVLTPASLLTGSYTVVVSGVNDLSG